MSLPCPRCGKSSQVLDTRTLPANNMRGVAIRRRRECVRKHRWTTIEVEAAVWRGNPEATNAASTAELRAAIEVIVSKQLMALAYKFRKGQLR